MAQIHVLDSETIDKIAAGEVVEKPASVVKELVENAIDAGATAITVEIKDGGIEFIRVTDNGAGMEKDQIRTAFMRHATSKIRSAGDLTSIASLGFRGEALSSIAAVSKVELISKTKETLTGTRILLEGGKEVSFDEVGAPDGTTFIVRNLFYNTPVRRKFLKTAATEGSYIAELLEHLALSRPDISFKFVAGNQTKFYTSGNGDLKEVIYRIYGKEIASNLVPIEVEEKGIRISGFLGKPVQVRSNRNFEIYFINGRYVQSTLIYKAIEEGYKEYLMQHKFPVCVLHITMDSSFVDVNVHPTKMDVRFSDNLLFSQILSDAVRETLKNREMIPEVTLEDSKESEPKDLTTKAEHIPEPFELQRSAVYRLMEEHRYRAETEPKVEPREEPKAETKVAEVFDESTESLGVSKQMDLFEERILTRESRQQFRMIGQVFQTYWLVEYMGELFIIDQHAAHEKVYYERLMKRYQENAVVSQQVFPPVIVSLSSQEEVVLKEHLDKLCALGFEIESFGGNEYALRTVPTDLYGCNARDMFLDMLGDLAQKGNAGNLKLVEERIASMACKAAVKGNMVLSMAEAEALIDVLLTLENPYNCPHGRPTIISMNKTELEKKFKRIVS